MVKLFSTLLSNTSSDEATSAPSSSSIPTLIQLFTSTPLCLADKQIARHAILSYQAMEVDGSSPQEEDETLFGRTRKTTSTTIETPNLGVWLCRVSKDTSNLVDSLLTIPSCNHMCLTVDLSDPTTVEPSLTRMQEALVRFLIASPKKGSTSLYDLKSQNFGLAAEDDSPPSTSTGEPSDQAIGIHLLICAIRPPRQDDYKKTQAQNLLFYHLRRFAVAINATLCMVAKDESAKTQDDAQASPEEEEEQPTLTTAQVAHVWRDFVEGKFEEEGETDDQQPAAVYTPDKNPELIETVLLRNANCPGQWETSKDSLWKALPPISSTEEEDAQGPTPKSGDQEWLTTLRDSLGTAPVADSPAPKPATKKDDAEVSSFFENLLKK